MESIRSVLLSFYPKCGVMRAQPPNLKDPGDPGFVHSSWLSFSDWWTPVITGCSVANNKVHQTWVDLSVEWQAFVGRRINRVLHLFQELCAAKSPDDALQAWSCFWRQAAADYDEEYSAIAKRAACFIPDRTTPSDNADAQPRSPQSKAA